MIRRVLGVVAGSLIYRFIYAAALRFNVPAEYMKLVSAVIVGVAIAAPEVRRWTAFQMEKSRERQAKKDYLKYYNELCGAVARQFRAIGAVPLIR